MAEELLSALMSGFQNRKGAGLSPEVLEAMQRNPYFADVYGGMIDARRDAFGGGEGAGYGVGQAAGDAMHAGSQAIQGLPHRMSEMGQQGGDALASVLAGAQGAMAPMVDMAGNMAEGFGTGGMDQDPELGRMVQAMGAPGNPEAYRNVTERPPGYDMGRMAGRGMNAAGDMIGGAMDAVGNVDADAVLAEAMGLGGKMADAGQGAMGAAKEALGGMAGNVMDSLGGMMGGGGDQAPAGSFQAVAGAPMLTQPGEVPSEAQIQEHMRNFVGSPQAQALIQQASGGGGAAPQVDPQMMQQLQQILSPEELQAVIQDPQKMAEIQALLQQGMGGQ